MSQLAKPNTWIAIHADGNTHLTYDLQTNPAPLTVSVPQESPELASLQFVVTNQTNAPVMVESITFTLEAGTSGASITPSTDGLLTQVSDTVNWNVTKPGLVTSGPAPFVLEPAAGAAVTLAAGASVVVEIYHMQTVEVPGTSTVAIKEVLQGAAPTFASFSVTTFPDGFYFNGLIATVPNGSNLVPVAQIANNGSANVTLVWNSSVTEPDAFTIFYSTAGGGQQTGTTAVTGQWTSPPLASDTVFTVMVKISMTGGEPLVAALSTAVSVQNPDLIAANVTTGSETVTGILNVDGATYATGITATGVTVNGTLGATTANVSGALSADSANITVGVSAESVTVSSLLDVTANGVLAVDSAAEMGGRFFVRQDGAVGIGTVSPMSKMHLVSNYSNNGVSGFTLDASDSGAAYYLQINPFVVSGGSVGYQFNTYCPNSDTQYPLTLTDSGNVGIGIIHPIAPLHVQSSFNVPWPIQDQYTILGYQWNSSSSNNFILDLSDGGQVAFGNVSILAAGSVAAPQFDAFSDERIKNVERRSDSSQDLATLLKLEVTDYRYKDVSSKGRGARKKVIAQQVEKVFPQAVSLITGVIPDIYAQATMVEGWVELATDLKKGEQVRLISDTKDEIYEVIEAETDRFCVQDPPADEKIFVYGRQVKDFRTVDYDALSMLHLSATQQLKQDTDEEIKELRAMNLALIKRLEALEHQLEIDGIGKADVTSGH